MVLYQTISTILDIFVVIYVVGGAIYGLKKKKSIILLFISGTIGAFGLINWIITRHQLDNLTVNISSLTPFYIHTMMYFLVAVTFALWAIYVILYNYIFGEMVLREKYTKKPPTL